MTAQSSFTVLAAVHPEREAELRRLLASMNDAPGRVKADNRLIPFQQFDTLHVARLLIVDDKTVDDIRVYGIPPRAYPRYLSFLGDVDGDANAFLAEVARRAPEGLRALFSCCEGFTPGTDLIEWMKAHSVPTAAGYVNWRGRTVQQVREESALRDAVECPIQGHAATLKGLSPPEIHTTLQRLVLADVAAGRLTLSPERQTPL